MSASKKYRFLVRVIVGLAMGGAALLIIWAGGLVAITVRYPRPVIDLGMATREAKVIIHEAGGIEKICGEADLVFQRFGVRDYTPLFEAELQTYPTLRALGPSCVIMPDSPTYLQVRMGREDSFSAYWIIVTSTNSGARRISGANEAEIGPRVYVRR